MKHIGKWVGIGICVGTLASGSVATAFGPAAGGGGERANASAASEQIKVEKAKGANAYSVSETYEKAGKLDKNPVVVRGKVVKVSRGIMGKNWVHLRDGSGDSGKGTNDLVVTTQDVPKVGDVVTAKGTLHKDKDFGAGYMYKVIVEEATVKQ